MRTCTQAICGLALLLIGGCANGDFGRVRPQLVNDDIHNWVGRQAAREYGHAPSSNDLTDDERQLRDLAYPLIEPPLDRGKWDSILYEYGLLPTRGPWWPPFDHRTYGRKLLSQSFRSPVGRYSQLIDDIRNDDVRIAPFVAVASRVVDMDSKRHRSLAYVSDLPANARRNARRRIAENARVVAWVHHSLRERAAAYRYALERVLVETPSPMAVEAERALRLLRQRIATTRLG